MAQKQRLSGGAGPGADDGDRLVGQLIGVADGALADQPLADLVQRILHRRQPVAHPRGQDQVIGQKALPRGLDREQAIGPLRGIRGLALDRRDPELVHLLAHPVQQRAAPDAVGIAGMVVRPGDQRRPAVPLVDQRHPPPEPRQIDRRRHAGRAAADDDAVEGLCFAAHRTPLPDGRAGRGAWPS